MSEPDRYDEKATMSGFAQFCPRCPCVVATYQEKCPTCGGKMWTPEEWSNALALLVVARRRLHVLRASVAFEPATTKIDREWRKAVGDELEKCHLEVHCVISAIAPAPAAAPAAETALCQCSIGAVAASCAYAAPNRPCECACHAPPSEPAAPTAEVKVNACQVDLRTDKDRECFDDIVQAATRVLRSEPVTPAPLLPRVLAALTGAAIDAASHGHVKTARDRDDLAAELRAYIAERAAKEKGEGKT